MEIKGFLVPESLYKLNIEETETLIPKVKRGQIFFYKSLYPSLKNGNKFVLKIVKYSFPANETLREKERNNLKLEFKSAQRCFQSKHVIQPVSMALNETHAGILMENGGEQILQQSIKLGWGAREFAFAFLELAKGLQDLHNEGIHHGDIKPQNIMYDQLTNSYKYTDFGSAILFYGHVDILKTRQITDEILLRTITETYAAPEIMWAYNQGRLSEFKYDKIDIFSLALTIYSLIIRQYPSKIEKPLKDHPDSYQHFIHHIIGVMDHKIAAEMEGINRAVMIKLKELISLSIQQTARERPSLDDIITQLEIFF